MLLNRQLLSLLFDLSNVASSDSENIIDLSDAGGMIQKRLLINDDKAPTTWKMPEQRFCGASRTIRCEYEPIALGYYQHDTRHTYRTFGESS